MVVQKFESLFWVYRQKFCLHTFYLCLSSFKIVSIREWSPTNDKNISLIKNAQTKNPILSLILVGLSSLGYVNKNTKRLTWLQKIALELPHSSLCTNVCKFIKSQFCFFILLQVRLKFNIKKYNFGTMKLSMSYPRLIIDYNWGRFIWE